VTTTDVPVFAGAAMLYHQAGWPAVLPVPPETKSPPPTGYTGAEGLDTPADLLNGWASGTIRHPSGSSYAAYSCALRMPDGVIGIDVDQYTTAAGRVKRGAETLAKLVDRWGPLPPTWTSTARGADGPSRIAFFRVPAGRYVSVLQPDIEIIQRHHRYAVVWPSVHEELGTVYTWYAPDGTVATRLPSPTDFAWAPETWAVGLAEGASTAAPASASHASGDALLAALSVDARPACSVMYDALEAAARVLAEQLDSGTRHDAMTKRVHRIVQTAAMGHPGLGAALPGLREQWTAITSGESREAEFDRMLLSSARKAVTVLGGVQQLGDPCSMFGGAAWAGLAGMQVDARPRPSDDREFGEDSEPFEPLHLELPPKLVDPSWGQVIGTEPFDPGVDLDHPLADAMLRRSFYMVRRASDTKTAWLQRGAEQWTLEGDLAGRIVSECAALMPDGDPEPIVKGMPATPAQRAYKRRLRMMTNGPAAAVAATIRRQTDGGRHPATVAVADLDREPDVLWAGGWPWDLRASTEVPTLAAFVDPHQPHLVAAGVTPAPVPTPRWDAFVAAVWPDDDVRRWALRVLSIAFTGYPDAALPLLYGEGGTGKTSLITLLMEVLGSYAHAANPKLLSDRADQFMTYQLKGRRLSFIDEAMREGHRNAETLKQLTGGGALSGSAKYQNEITFQPTHTLVLTSNTPPTVSDAAVRRRIRLLPCDGDAAEVRARRQALGARHWAVEAPGVLAAMMREAGAWLADPTTALVSAAPLSVQFLLGELVSSQDVIGQWLTESVMPDQVGTPSHRLYVGFRGWCRDAGIRDGAIATETAWALALTQLGFDKVRRRDANYRLLVVRPDPGFAFTPSTPPPSAFSTPSTPPPAAYPPHTSGVEGSWNQGGASDGQPSTIENRSSTPLSTTSVEGVEGRSNTLKNEVSEKGPIEERTENLRTLFELPSPSTDDLPRQGVTSEKEAVEAPPHSPHAPTISPNGVVGPIDAPLNTLFDLQEQPAAARTASPREINASEVAARAYQGQATKQLTKAEARKQLAAEKRAAAIAEAITAAQGEVLALPAVVDRAGHVIPVSLEQAGAVVRGAIARSGQLDVDVETSGYPVGHPLYELRSVQLGDSVACVVLHPVTHAELIRALLAEAPTLGAFSATADLVPLAYAGLGDHDEMWMRMHDVVIPAKLADPRSIKGAAADGLKAIAAVTLGPHAVAPGADAARSTLFTAGKWLKETKIETPLERSGWANVNTGSTVMLRYAASDVLDTAACGRAIPRPEPVVYERERLAQRMTARVAYRGVRIDADHVRALTPPAEQARAAAGALVQAFGIDNPGSDMQIGQALDALGAPLPRSEKTGRPSVAAAVLEPLRAAEGPIGDLARAVLDYRHHDTVLGTFLAPYRLLCEQGDGRARPTVYTLGTVTGRMSCVRPNLQQLPREGGVRACITADPGQLMIGADFSGVEIRVAAALSQDPAMLAMLAEGQDLHAVIAEMVFGPGWTKANRYTVKPMVFGDMYGAGVPTMAAQGGCTPAVAQAAKDAITGRFPRYRQWSDEVRNAAKAGRTQLPTYSGRTIHLDPSLPHKAPNAAIQGTARELLIDTLVRWQDTRWGDATLLPVHDELDVFVPESEAVDATAELVRCMETELYGVAIVAEPAAPSFFWQDST
jgi:P4 family phage/plasmid primase-like protien